MLTTVDRSAINHSIEVFTAIPKALDRLARSYYQKSLILEDLNHNQDAVEALYHARRLRHDLVGNEELNDDSMEAYDSLVYHMNRCML